VEIPWGGSGDITTMTTTASTNLLTFAQGLKRLGLGVLGV
jgi:Na+/citrate or Na+/malate symporter